MPSKNKIRKIVTLSLVFYLVLCGMLFICETADARAGGGQAYSSGSSGGGGVGGGDIFIIIKIFYHLIRLCINYPAIGFPLAIFFLWFLWFMYWKGDNYLIDSTIRKANAVSAMAADRSAMGRIKVKDPAFNEEEFCKRAEKAFMIVQEAWSKGDLTRAAAFLADGTYEQFLIQLRVMKEKNLMDVMENLQIKSTLAVGFESDGKFDSIHLAITASSKSYRADIKTKKFVEGNRIAEEFTEVWTFLRRTGAKSLKKPGLIEGFCPNCGTPVSMSRHSKCSSCGSILRSGEHDWVLANITQACEWKEKRNDKIPGFKRYQVADAGFNIQHIEDRVSVMFWRKNEAERLGKVDPMRKIATDSYCEAQSKWYKPDSSGSRKFYAECAVGIIEVMAIDTETNPVEDYVFAKVIWSGIPSKRSRDGKITSVVSKVNIKSVFVLKRKRGVTTDSRTTLISGHCPSCGAPESDNLSNSCEYCGNVVNDGARDWVLEAVLDPFDANLNRAITLVKDVDAKSPLNAVNNEAVSGEIRSPKKKTYSINDYTSSMNRISGIDMMKWTIAMMLADGHIDSKELKIIYDLGIRRGVSKNGIDNLIEDIKKEKNPVEYVMQSADLPLDVDLMRMLIRIAYSDGKVTKEEVEMIRLVGRKMNLDENAIKKLLTDERMNLYRMSKAVIEESKAAY